MRRVGRGNVGKDVRGPAAWVLFPLLLGVAALGAAAGGRALDTTAPTIADILPEEGAFVNAAALGLSGVAHAVVQATITDDVPVGVANVTAHILNAADGSEVVALEVNASPGHPGAVEVAGFPALNDGEYRLEVEARDGAGNAAREERNFTVDTKAPWIAASAPAISKDRVAVLTIDARDATSGIALPLQVSYRSACASTWVPEPVDVTLLPGRALAQAALALCEGTNNQYSVAVRDRAGNVAELIQRKVAYDTQAPGFTSFAPGPFERVDEAQTTLEVWVTDNAVGVNRSSVEAQVSGDGGLTWGAWRKAAVTGNGTYVRGWIKANFTAGATAAVRWRASDLAGNGPAESDDRYFYLNGPPFVVSFEPPEGAQIYENAAVRLSAEFADPDADIVEATVTSDIDGALGRADGRRVHLSPGLHTLTLAGDDGHGHLVTYAYQVEVISRLPPDLRPLFFTFVIAGAMVWAAYAAWTREGEGEEDETAKS